jgi:hypothetical protein
VNPIAMVIENNNEPTNGPIAKAKPVADSRNPIITWNLSGYKTPSIE